MVASHPTALVALLVLGCFTWNSSAAVCPDDPEVDLCDDELDASSASPLRVPSRTLTFPIALALWPVGMKHGAWLSLLAPLASLATPAAGMTCGDLKDHYKTEECCGSPDKELSKVPGAAACPYNFNKPACDDAEPQSPRDLTAGASGQMIPKAATLNEAQAAFLPLTNVHFHLGAEHKTEAYSDGTASAAYDATHARRLAEGAVRPGWMCSTSDLSTEQLASYTFQYCKGDVAVGKSYEVHYVHSSAGYSQADLVDASVDGIEDGLGGAANGRGLLNPMVVVQGLVFQIVNGAEAQDELLNNTWTALVDKANSVMYAGSTTGPSHNDEVCSPYAVTWHVDKSCHRVSPASFDNLCKQMKDLYNLEADLYPHGSRKIVDSKYVVKSEYVYDLA